MRTAALLTLSLVPAAVFAQTVPAPVPENEVFKREDIGHALAAPTPQAGHTAASSANAPPDDGQWTMPSKNYASTRFSNLSEITVANVKTLTPDFSFSLAVNKGQEAAPIVADNTMYIVTAYPNIVYALDLTKPGAPLKWSFAPKPAPASQGIACCDVVNRGGSVDDGKYIFNTLDGQTIAVDVKTGRPLWRTQLGNINKGESITMAPTVAQGPGLRRRFGRGDGCPRLVGGTRRKYRQTSLARLQHGPRFPGADRFRFQAALSQTIRARIWGSAAGRRRHGKSAAAAPGVGSPSMPSSSALRRGGKSRTLESISAPGRQQMDGGNLCARPRDRLGALVLSIFPAR